MLDELLVLRCKSGDAQALEELSRRWHRRILGQACLLTGGHEAAAEVAQEAWSEIVRGIRRLEDPARFAAWAHRIVARKATDWIRRRQRRRRLNFRVSEEQTRAPEVVAAEGREQQILELRSALRELPDDRRAILSMFYLEGLGEPSLPEMVTEVFQGRHRWLVGMSILIGIVFTTLWVYALVRFLETDDVPRMLRWGALLAFSMVSIMAVKVWYWMELQRNALTREIKRVELQIVHLVGRGREQQQSG